MAEAFTLTITTAGRDALVDAQNGETDAIRVSEVGFSDQAFIAAPTLTALPGEVKRISSVSGTSISETVIHMTALDASEDIYDVRGFALFLEDGTLFAAYAQADPIVSKAAILNLQLAFDIAFQDSISGDIEFGDATFLFPPATETVKGVAEIATQAEVDDGADDERFVTPLKLATRLAEAFGAIVDATETVKGVAELATQAEVNAGADDQRIVTPLKLATRLAPIIQSVLDEASARATAVSSEASARSAGDTSLSNSISALAARTITGGGLASGGGSLAANRVITVAAASVAQMLTGTASNVALTPATFGPIVKSLNQNGYVALALGDPANALMIAWGRFTAFAKTNTSVSFPISFAQCFSVVCSGASGGSFDSDQNEIAVQVNSITPTGFQVASSDNGANSVAYLAIGRIDLT